MKIPLPSRLLAALALAAGLQAAAPGPDFNGVWKLTRIDGKPVTVEQTLTAGLAGDQFTLLTRTPGGPSDRQTFTETYLLDGKAHDFTPPARTGSNSARGRRVATLLNDKATVVILEDITREMADGTLASRQYRHTWAVSLDGQTLTHVSTIRGQQAEVSTTRTYSRQPGGGTPP